MCRICRESVANIMPISADRQQSSITGASKHPDNNRGRLYRPQRFNSLTRQRFALDRMRQLTRHLGREPSYTERVLIDRCIANEWDLRRLDARLDAGEELSGHAARLRLALENRLRLDLRELGLQPATAKPTNPMDDLRNHLARREVVT
jgi:hypothetical protein